MQRNKLTWKSYISVKKYKDKRYKNPDQRLISYIERSLVRRTLSGILRSKGLILDIPCGYGRFSDIFVNYSKKLVSADLNIYALSLIKNEHRRNNSINIFKYTNSDIISLPFKDNTFDLVFCFRLLQHFKDFNIVKLSLEELIRVSRRYVMFSIYIDNRLHQMMRKVKGSDRNIFMFSKDRLKGFFRGRGVKIVYLKNILPYFHANSIVVVEKLIR